MLVYSLLSFGYLGYHTLQSEHMVYGQLTFFLM
jgi:hypothetical protein